MPWTTKDGRTVDEARAAVIAALGLNEDDLEIEVLNEGAKGLFGFGGEPAVVRARPRGESVDVREAFRDRPPAFEPASRTEDDEVPADQGVSTEAEKPGLPADERIEITRQVAVEMVEGVLKRFGLSGEVRTRVQSDTVYVEVFGEDMGILIGRGGATLEALQDLVRAGVQRRLKARGSVVVDVESYWERRRTRRPTDDTGRSRAGRDGGRNRS